MRSLVRIAVLASLLLAPLAPAAVLFNNIPASPGNNGPSSDSSAVRYARSFVPTSGGQATSLTIWGQAITGLGTGNYTLQLRTDVGSAPGVLLASGTGTQSTAGGLTTVSLGAGAAISVGVRYWVVFFGDWPTWQNVNTTTEPAPGILRSTNSGTSWALNSGGVGPQYPLTLRVDGSPVNTPPTATGESYSTNEDTTLTVAAPGVLSNDTDAEANALTAVLVTAPTRGTLTLNANGSFTYVPGANLNGADSFVYRANDGQANSGNVTVTLTVNSVNDVPSFTKGADVTVNEDAAAQSLVNWATAISAGALETTQTLTFTVTAGNTALFSAQPALSASGTLSFTPAANVSGFSLVTVTLADNGGTANGGVSTSAAQTFFISVNAVNDAPTFQPLNPVTVNEDAAAQTLLNFATGMNAGPNEGTQTLTFTTTAVNAALFTVQPSVSATGTLTFTPAPNAFGTTTLNVTLQDNGGTISGGVDSLLRSTTITINAVNDAPSFVKGADVTVLEDSGAQTVNAWATALSAGPGEGTQALSFVVTAATPALFAVQPAISATGTLTFTPAANASGTTLVTVTPFDDGGTANGGVNTAAAQTFTIAITAVNDAPSFAKGADVTLLEDAAAQIIPAWASAISAGAGEATQTVSFTVVASTPARFSTQPAISSSGALTFTPAANAFGTTTITVTANDTGGTANGGVNASAPQTFTITVTAVNDAPSFVSGLNVTVNEDAPAQLVAGWASAVSPGPGESSQGVLFAAVASDTSLFLAQPAISSSGELSFTPAADAFGVATVTVTLADNGGTANGGVDAAAAQTFTITLTSVNDAPRFLKGADVTVAQDSGAHSELLWASLISAGPANESAQTLLFSAITDNDALFSMRPEILLNGTLSFTPAANASGVANVSITLSDNGGMANGGIDTTATQTMVITVTGIDAGVADAGIDAGALDAGTPGDAGVNDDAGVFDDAGVMADAGSTGGGAGGGTGGGSAATGGGGGGGGGEVDAGVDPGGSTPGCGCSGTAGTGSFMFALVGLLVLSRRKRLS